MPIAHCRKAERLVGLGIFVVTYPDERRFQKFHDRREDFFPR